MNARVTPFALVFAELAPERFPDIARATRGDATVAADRDRFVLLAPVGRLLRDLAPDDAPPEAMEAYVRLVHHAYRHWAAGGLVYDVSEPALERAIARESLSSAAPHPAFYLRLPSLKVWGAAQAGTVPEPLDGAFVTTIEPAGTIAVLGVLGMHGERPGFSAVAVEGRADPDSATAGEVEVVARRDDGSALFAPQLEGGREAGVHSIADAGELLLLLCRILPTLPAAPAVTRDDRQPERIVPVD